jgi:GGDEF domain-containing protein
MSRNLGPVWSSFVRLYWILALIPLLGLPAVWAYPSQLLLYLALLYWISLPLLYFGLRRYPKLAVEIHLFLAYVSFVVALSNVNQLPNFFDQGWRNGIGIFGVVGLIGLATVGGWSRGVPAFLILLLYGYEAQGVALLLVFSSFLLALVAGIAIHQIVNNLERAYLDLAKAARVDTLTQLGNRRALDEDYAQLTQKGNPPQGYLLLFDLDGLKQINDQQGHLAGDRFLRDFAQVLRQEIPMPVGLYRTGGDEFCAIVVGDRDAAQLGRQVALSFEQVSWGFTDLLASLDDTLRAADRQMYLDKGRKTGQQMSGS